MKGGSDNKYIRAKNVEGGYSQDMSDIHVKVLLHTLS